MKKHFFIIHKKSAIFACLLTVLSIIVFSSSLVKFLTDKTLFLFLPVIVFAVGFVIGIIILISVLTAGIYVKDGMVLLPYSTTAKGKQPKFNISELAKVDLCDRDGRVLNPYCTDLRGAYIVFVLKDGSFEKYRPASITSQQFKKIQKGMMEMAEGE